jgi:hypothetical protein
MIRVGRDELSQVSIYPDNKLRSIRLAVDDVAVDLILRASRIDRALSFDAVATGYSSMRNQLNLRFLCEKVLTLDKT